MTAIAWAILIVAVLSDTQPRKIGVQFIGTCIFYGGLGVITALTILEIIHGR